MPYIIQEDRDAVDAAVDKLVEAIRRAAVLAGALNYAICRLAVGVTNPSGYEQIANMIGHVNRAAGELERRMLDPYEDKCIKLNGDLEEFERYDLKHSV